MKGDLQSFLSLHPAEQQSWIEALLFASDEPLSRRALEVLLAEDGEAPVPAEEDPEQEKLDITVEEREPDNSARRQREQFDEVIERCVAELNALYADTGRAFRIVDFAGGYHFATTAEHGDVVARLVKTKSRKRLSRAALETLAIIAYQQPVTKTDVEQVRGVNSGEVINKLLEKNVVTIVGRAESVGKPLLYGTTDEFLRVFGLRDLSELPKLREIDELMKDGREASDILSTITVSSEEDARAIEQKLADMGIVLPEDVSLMPAGTAEGDEAATEEDPRDVAPALSDEHPEEHPPASDEAESEQELLDAARGDEAVESSVSEDTATDIQE